MKPWLLLGALAVPGLAFACSEDVGKKNDATAVTGVDGGADGSSVGNFDVGEELKVPVPDGQRVFVSLASPPSLKTVTAPATDKSWDLAFEGYDVFTNSGPSGSGAAQAFGPLDTIVFLDTNAPQVPFLSKDETGGAFLRWWYYSGAPDHVLYSRFHVYGVKDGDKLYRVQILGYYGQRDGTAVAALYKIRYAAVGEAAKELDLIDGTGQDQAANDCVDLGTGAKVKHTPAEALTATDWHLCFRRESISVNGEQGGPRGVTAVDLNASSTATETLDGVSALTPEQEAPKFDAVNAASFDGQSLRGDRIVSVFTSFNWLDRTTTPPSPAKSAWYTIGADGKTGYLVGFSRFEGATATTPGTVVVRVKAVK